MNIRFHMLAFATLGLFLSSAANLSAQDLVLQVDRSNGSFALTGADSNVVDFAQYRIESAATPTPTLVPANFNGIRDTEPNWALSGVNVPSSAALGEASFDPNPAIGALVNDTVSLDLGTGVYDPTQAILDAGFGVDVEVGDLSITYFNQIAAQTVGDDGFRTGLVEFVGEKIFNNIGITVDLTAGTAVIENESPFNQTITGYLIEAATPGTLNTNLGTFTGIAGFTSPTTLDGENIGQVDASGTGIAVNANEVTQLNIGEVGGTLDDLSFSFILAGVGEVSRPGFVKYINVPVSDPGDFNADGIVNTADYVLWRANLGALDETSINGNGDGMNGVDEADYTLWRNNFGATFPALAPVVATPEPTSLLLILAGITLAGMTTRRV